MISWITETPVESYPVAQMAALTSTMLITRDLLNACPPLESSPSITITVTTYPSLTSLFLHLKLSPLEPLLGMIDFKDMQKEALDQGLQTDSRLEETPVLAVLLLASCQMLKKAAKVLATSSWIIFITNLKMPRALGDLLLPSLEHILLDKQRLKTLVSMVTGVMLKTLVSSTTTTTDPCFLRDGDLSSVSQQAMTNGRELINSTHLEM